MKYVPHDYQAYCIQRVVEDPAVGLFLRPGLGKQSSLCQRSIFSSISAGRCKRSW